MRMQEKEKSHICKWAQHAGGSGKYSITSKSTWATHINVNECNTLAESANKNTQHYVNHFLVQEHVYIYAKWDELQADSGLDWA